MIIPISRVLALRGQASDQTLLDYLTLVHLRANPGTITVATLRERWSCSQPQVSRRLSAVAAAGLAEITPGWGAYQVHAVTRLEVSRG
jgi:DNA-binding MarR family transcriptional regulator